MKRIMQGTCAAVLCAALTAGFGVQSARAEKRVGVVIFSSEQRYLDARDGALEALKKQGFAAPQVTFEQENADGSKTKAADIAKKMAAAKYDLVLAVGTTAVVAVAGQVKDVPLVFAMVYDPVDSKIAKDWASSGNNTTGTSPRVPMGRLLGSLKLLKPVKTMGVMYTPGEKNSETQLKEIQAEQQATGIKVLPIPLAGKDDLNSVAADAIGKVDAVFFTGAAIVGENLPALVGMAGKSKAVSVSHLEDYVVRGVLYGMTASPAQVGRLAGEKAAKVLNGASPASVPIEMLAEFDVLLNQKTADAAGIAVPAEFRKMVTRTIQ